MPPLRQSMRGWGEVQALRRGLDRFSFDRVEHSPYSKPHDPADIMIEKRHKSRGLGEGKMGMARNDTGGQSSNRVNQSIVGGLVLVALAGLALYGARPLAQGTLGSMGPGLLPRTLAVGVGLCGLALIVIGVRSLGEKISGVSWRGAILIPVAIVLFALTIRPFNLGFVTTPGLGLVVAAPLAIIVAGYATPEARLKELIPLALILTSISMILFGDLLNLPIPNYPQSLAAQFPQGWSQRAILRALAAVLFVVGSLAVLPFIFARRGGAR